MSGLVDLQEALDQFPEKEFHYDPSVVNTWLKDFRRKFAVFRHSLENEQKNREKILETILRGESEGAYREAYEDAESGEPNKYEKEESE